MDDGRVLAVEVEETVRDVHQHGQLDGERHVLVRLQALLQVHVQVLQDQREVARVRAVVHAEELDDVRVADAAQEKALVAEALSDGAAVDARHRVVGEDVVEPFRDARHPVDPHLVHGAKASRAFLVALLQPLQVFDHVPSQLLIHLVSCLLFHDVIYAATTVHALLKWVEQSTCTF